MTIMHARVISKRLGCNLRKTALASSFCWYRAGGSVYTVSYRSNLFSFTVARLEQHPWFWCYCGKLGRSRPRWTWNAW